MNRRYCSRLVWLYLRSRSAGRWALAIGAVSLIALWHRWWTPERMYEEDVRFARAIGQSISMVLLPGMTATAFGMALHDPFGDLDRPMSGSLRWLRIVHLAGLLALGCVPAIVAAATWPPVLPSVPVAGVVIRNTFVLGAVVLVIGRWLDVRRGALLPLVAALATIVWAAISVRSGTEANGWWTGRSLNPLLGRLDWWVMLLVIAALAVAVAGYARDGLRDAIPEA